MKRKVLCSSLASILFVLFAAAMLGAQPPWNYSRPNPVMDYVPQEMGMYDTAYWELGEDDCRGCHGQDLSRRHHCTDAACNGACNHCHVIVPGPPGGVVVVKDCLTSGCHSWDDVDIHRWHHSNEDATAGNCIASGCHDPALIGAFGPGVTFQDDPPKVTPPTPYSCENCHWEQASPVEGGKAIRYGLDTHRSMGLPCYMCHSFGVTDADNLNWDPDNAERIRHCEKCHTKETLHDIHRRDFFAWEAVGFHVDHDTEDTPEDPVNQRLFTSDEICSSCHASSITFSPVANRTTLKPPNHKMVDIEIETNVSNDPGWPVTLTAEVASNEPEDGLGDGDKAPDWTEPVIDQDTGIITLQLRAERSGSGEGRKYTITITGTDSCGGYAVADVKIEVPNKKSDK